MVSRHRVATTASTAFVPLLLPLLLVFAGCRKPPPSLTDAGPPDHLTKNEAVEGKDKAFALPLPHAAKVYMRFPTSVHVHSTLKPEDLANFVRPRVKSGRVLIGATMTTFENVIVPAEPKRQITIEIRPGRDFRSEMVVRDVTPPPPPDPNESQADRMHKAGLTPDGKLIDPKHMQ